MKKKQKNISSELLESFGRQLTREDISSKHEEGIPFNWLKYSKGSDACQEGNEKNIHPKISTWNKEVIETWISDVDNFQNSTENSE